MVGQILTLETPRDIQRCVAFWDETVDLNRFSGVIILLETERGDEGANFEKRNSGNVTQEWAGVSDDEIWEKCTADI